jgi:serine/threonine protein kinase
MTRKGRHRWGVHSSDEEDEADRAGAAARQRSPAPPAAAARAGAGGASASGAPPPASAFAPPPGAHAGVDLPPPAVAAALACRRARPLGAGGFGKVVAAELPPLGRVALKLAAPGAERALAAEAIHLRRAAHPAAARALGTCWAPGGPSALALELLPGGPLDGRLAAAPCADAPPASPPAAGRAPRPPKPPLPWRVRVRVAYQVASVLSYLHSRLGILHCDVKPGNVLVSPSGDAALIDFGVARPAAAGDARAAAAAAAALARAAGGARTPPPGGSRTPPLGGSRTPPLGGSRTPPPGGVRSGSSGGGSRTPPPPPAGGAAAHLAALTAGVARGAVAQLHGWCGTPGYVDPCFKQLGELCDKSDVFSLVRPTSLHAPWLPAKAPAPAPCSAPTPMPLSPLPPRPTHPCHPFAHPTPSQGVIMAQLLLDSDDPTEARRRALHQVKSGEMHLPDCLADWPRQSALAFGALALRCASAGERDARPRAAEAAGTLRELLLDAGEPGVGALAAGGLRLCADGAEPSRGSNGSSGGGGGAPGAQAAGAPPHLPAVVTLRLELAAGSGVAGDAILQPPHPAATTPAAAAASAAADPAPPPLRVTVARGKWDAATGRLSLALAAPGSGSGSGDGGGGGAPAQAAAPANVRAWPVEFEGTYIAGQLAGTWTYRAPAKAAAAAAPGAPAKAAAAAAARGGAKPVAAGATATGSAARPAAGQAWEVYSFVSHTPAPAPAPAPDGEGTAQPGAAAACAPGAAAAAANPAPGLVRAV